VATAYVLINCEPGSDDFVVSELKAIDSVKAVHGTFGTFDVIAKIEDDSEERLNNVITKQIRKLEKIRSTLTLYAVGSKDHFFDKSANQKDASRKNLVQAYVIIHCEDADDYEVLRDLSQIFEVIDGDVVIGVYEIICKVAAPTYNDIEDVITKKIRKIEKIKSTITLNIIPENG
jgi:DNA-binding Lrp family transcriptional regulator